MSTATLVVAPSPVIQSSVVVPPGRVTAGAETTKAGVLPSVAVAWPSATVSAVLPAVVRTDAVAPETCTEAVDGPAV